MSESEAVIAYLIGIIITFSICSYRLGKGDWFKNASDHIVIFPISILWPISTFVYILSLPYTLGVYVKKRKQNKEHVH